MGTLNNEGEDLTSYNQVKNYYTLILNVGFDEKNMVILIHIMILLIITLSEILRNLMLIVINLVVSIQQIQAMSMLDYVIY